MASRESILVALLALVAGAGSFVTVSRRNKSPDAILAAETPALFLVETSDNYHRPSPNVPPRREMTVTAMFYNDIGQDENAIPSTAINNALDALDALLKADLTHDGRVTLGGLVWSLVIDGEVKRAPGEITGKSLALVPMRIVLP